jgi:hypothetical protein
LDKIFLSVLLASLIAILIFSVIPVAIDAKLYQKYTGEYITEEQYEAVVIECSKFQTSGYIDKSIDCAEWILTEEGVKGLRDAVNQRSTDIIENYREEYKNKK